VRALRPDTVPRIAGDSVSGVEPTRTLQRPGIGRLVVVALVAAGAVTGAVALSASGAGSPGSSGTTGATTGAGTEQDGPPPDPSLRFGTSADGMPYAFWAMDHRGDPLRWDACLPIRFVLNPQGAPEEADQDVRVALRILATAADLELILDGPTDEEPSAARPLVEADASGWRWLPVLIAWAEPGQGGLPLTLADRGLALPVAVRDGDREAYVTGQVILNASRRDLTPGFEDRRDAIGATLVHELAHLLGLDHVDDTTQLLSIDPGTGPVVLGSGDRAGLERLGRAAGCNPAPPAESGRGLTHGSASLSGG